MGQKLFNLDEREAESIPLFDSEETSFASMTNPLIQEGSYPFFESSPRGVSISQTLERLPNFASFCEQLISRNPFPFFLFHPIFLWKKKLVHGYKELETAYSEASKPDGGSLFQNSPPNPGGLFIDLFCRDWGDYQFTLLGI